MNRIIDIELKTVDIVFGMLKSDIELFDMAVSKKWEGGKMHYKKRIEGVFNKLKELESSINGATDEIENMTSGGDVADTIGMRSEYNRISKLIKRKVSALKGLHFEKEMRDHGFEEFESPANSFVVKYSRRLGDGTIETHKYDHINDQEPVTQTHDD
jgi:hypothetical protein